MTNLHQEHINLIEEYAAFKHTTAANTLAAATKYAEEIADLKRQLADSQRENAALKSKRSDEAYRELQKESDELYRVIQSKMLNHDV